MEILIKTCLMPLALKTQNDSFAFVHELKQEMHDDLKYVESFEKEIDELEYDKAKFSNMYDILLQEFTPHSWPQVRKSSFAKPRYVNAPGSSRNSPKHVSFQSPREFVSSNDMGHNYYLEEAKKKAQLQKDKALNAKPSVQQSARLPNTANGNKPKPRNLNQQPRNWPLSMSSRVSNRTDNIAEPPRNQKPFLQSKDLECDDHISDTQDADDEDAETEYDKDEIYKYKIRVHKDEDVEMKNAEVEDSDKDDAETSYDTTDAEINSLLDITIQSEVLHIQSPFVLIVLALVISEPSILTPIPETPLAAPVTTLPPPYLRVAKLEKDMFELKKIDLSAEALATFNSHVPNSALEILKIKREHVEKQKMLKFIIRSTDKAALKEYDQKSALYQTMHENKSFNRNLTNHKLYHTLMKSLIEDENTMDKGVADIIKDHKRKHDDDDDDDDEDPLAGPNQGKKIKRRRTKELESSKKPSITKETPKGKASFKSSKNGKSAFAKEPIKEPIAELIMAYVGNDVVRDDDLPQDASEPKTDKTPECIKLDYPFQECFNALTDKIDWNNPEGDCYAFDLSKPLSLQGHPCHLTDAAKKAEFPPTSSSLSVSLGFGNQFLKLSSYNSLVGTVKDTTDAEINSLLDITIQSEVLHIQSPFVLIVLALVISEPSILTPIPETPLAAPVTTLPPPYLRVAKLEKDMFELKKIDLSAEALATFNSHVPNSALEILKIKREHVEKQKMLKFIIRSTDKAALKEYDQKSALYQTMHENKSFNRNLTNHKLYHTLMKSLIEDENTMDKGVADIIKDHKRKHDDDDDDDDEDPLAGPNQGKKIKRRRTKELESSKKPSITKETPKDKIDWNNPEGDCYAFDLSKPLSLQGHPCHLTVVVDYFFNNYLEYLKSSNMERTYTTSITKIKVARYEIERVEDMAPMLWSPTKVGYDKDALRGIKH
nr:hypothetical protein [Tanacetum cinerariifolium]